MTSPSTSHFDLDQSLPATVKMEDLQGSQGPPTPSPDYTKSSSQSPSETTSPNTSATKGPKKRKSWGQVLPEPKTCLPPRKRAKTEDEKEQRRIERVKRNRLAAHNSRERKRQEVETLEKEKDALADQLSAAQEQVQRMARELAAYKQAAPEFKFEDSALPPTIINLETINPRKASLTASPTTSPSFSSLDSPSEAFLDMPTDHSTPMTEMSFTEPDLTQHSAAMLCDLQCQSEARERQLTTANFITMMVSLITLSLQSSMMTIMTTTSSILSRSAIRMISSTWLQRTTSSCRPSFRRMTLLTPALLTSMVPSYLTCSPNLAQQILFATVQASQSISNTLLVSQTEEMSESRRPGWAATRELRALRRKVVMASLAEGLSRWQQQQRGSLKPPELARQPSISVV